MFTTPGSRAKHLRRRKRGPTTHKLSLFFEGVGVIGEPFPTPVDIDAEMFGVGTMVSALSLIRGTDYTNPGGQGDRSAIIDVFFNKPLGGGGIQFQDISNAVDGAFGNTSGDAFWWTNGTDEARLLFDFRPSGFYQIVDEIKLTQQNASTHGNWVVEAWAGDTWEILKSSFVLGGAAINTIVFDNVKGYLIYQLRQIGGARSQSPWQQEYEFKIARGEPIPIQPTSYANVGGAGDRTGVVAVTTDIVFNSGTAGQLVDGVNTTGTTPVFQAGQTNRQITFDFTAIGGVLIDEITLRQGNASTHGYWIAQGSNDNAAWVDLGNWFEMFGILFGEPKRFNAMRGNIKKYLYYRLVQVSGTTSASPAVYEFEFKIAGATKVVQVDINMIGRGDIAVTFDGAAPPVTTTWKTGDRRSFIAVTVSPSDLIQQQYISGGQLPSDPNFLVAGGDPNLVLKHNQTAAWIKFEFDAPTIVDAFRWYQHYAYAPLNDQGVWQWQGSNDNSAWTNIGATLTLQGSPGNVTTYSRPNTTAYTWYRLLLVSGHTNAYNNEFHYSPLYVRRAEFRDNS